MKFLDKFKKNLNTTIEKKKPSIFSFKTEKVGIFTDKRIEVDLLEIDNLMPWFKEKIEKLESTENFSLLVLKKTNELLQNFNLENEQIVVQCIFNTKQNILIDLQIISYQTLSDTVNLAFGDTDMIVLK